MEKGVLSWSQLLDVGSKETRTELGTGLCSLLSLCTKLLYNVFFLLNNIMYLSFWCYYVDILVNIDGPCSKILLSQIMEDD